MIIRPYKSFKPFPEEDDMTAQPDTQRPTDIDQTLGRIRNIAAIAALVVGTAAAVVVIVLMVSLYPSLRRTVENLETASASAATAAADFAAVSDATAQALSETSVNLNEAAVNFKEASENFRQNSQDDSIAETILRLLNDETRTAGR